MWGIATAMCALNAFNWLLRLDQGLGVSGRGLSYHGQSFVLLCTMYLKEKKTYNAIRFV